MCVGRRFVLRPFRATIIDATYQGQALRLPLASESRAFSAQSARKDTNTRLGHYQLINIVVWRVTAKGEPVMAERRSSSLKRSCAILCCALMIWHVLGLRSFGRTDVSGDEWDEVFDTAREVLAKMPDADRIATITDASLRDAVRRAYRELKSCAKVNKNQSRSVKQAAVADFERAFKDVEQEAERGEYRECAAQCKASVAACERDCGASRKKICSCKMSQFGCLLTKCVFG